MQIKIQRELSVILHTTDYWWATTHKMRTKKRPNKTGLVVKLFVPNKSPSPSRDCSRTTTWRKKVQKDNKTKYDELLRKDRERQRKKWQRHKSDKTLKGRYRAKLARDQAAARMRLYHGLHDGWRMERLKLRLWCKTKIENKTLHGLQSLAQLCQEKLGEGWWIWHHECPVSKHKFTHNDACAQVGLHFTYWKVNTPSSMMWATCATIHCVWMFTTSPWSPMLSITAEKPAGGGKVPWDMEKNIKTAWCKFFES